MLLFYADYVIFFANTLGYAQKLLRALEDFCMHTKFSVNSSKPKIKCLGKAKLKINYALSTKRSHLKF